MNENVIACTPKSQYKNIMKALVHKAAFKFLIMKKEGHTKLDEINYTKLILQPYLSSSSINNNEKKLLYILRSKCHNSKMNFRKLNRNNLKCVLGCQQNEDQVHVFTQCQPLMNRLNILDDIQYNNILGSLPQQIELIKLLYKIDQSRNHILKNHLLNCQDPCTLDIMYNGAAYSISS